MFYMCQIFTICAKFSIWTQMVNWKILFYSTFLSPLISLFDFLSSFLESVCLSLSQVPNPCSSSSHNRTWARRRRWQPREEERQPQLRWNWLRRWIHRWWYMGLLGLPWWWSMVVDGFVGFAMVVNLSPGFIDGGRWVLTAASGWWIWFGFGRWKWV